MHTQKSKQKNPNSTPIIVLFYVCNSVWKLQMKLQEMFFSVQIAYLLFK